jgi:hypothetical protein
MEAASFYPPSLGGERYSVQQEIAPEKECLQ